MATGIEETTKRRGNCDDETCESATESDDGSHGSTDETKTHEECAQQSSVKLGRHEVSHRVSKLKKVTSSSASTVASRWCAVRLLS